MLKWLIEHAKNGFHKNFDWTESSRLRPFRKSWSLHFLVCFNILYFLFKLVDNEIIKKLHEQCYIAEGRRALGTFQLEYLQNRINSRAFQHFRPVMKILLVVWKSKKFNSKTLEQIQSCQIKFWWKKSSQYLWKQIKFRYMSKLRSFFLPVKTTRIPTQRSRSITFLLNSSPQV